MISRLIIAAILYLIIDGAWLLLIAKNFYKTSLRSFNIFGNIFYTIPVYILLIFGIVFFVLPKVAGDPIQALLWGFLLGIVIYGVYNFTNLAVLKDYPLKMAIIDFLWGSFVVGVVSYLTLLMDDFILR